jgi:hypothetical protein
MQIHCEPVRLGSILKCVILSVCKPLQGYEQGTGDSAAAFKHVDIYVFDAKFPLAASSSSRSGHATCGTAVTLLLIHRWDYDESNPATVRHAPNRQLHFLGWLQVNVRTQREQAEEYLRLHLESIPKDVGRHGTAFRMHQASSAAPMHGLLDYGRLALDARVALEFNPFFSEDSLGRLQLGARTWLQLCVLEDRLWRLSHLVDDLASSAVLIQVPVFTNDVTFPALHEAGIIPMCFHVVFPLSKGQDQLI